VPLPTCQTTPSSDCPAFTQQVGRKSAGRPGPRPVEIISPLELDEERGISNAIGRRDHKSADGVCLSVSRARRGSGGGCNYGKVIG
jgi:hypothetical protein